MRARLPGFLTRRPSLWVSSHDLARRCSAGSRRCHLRRDHVGGGVGKGAGLAFDQKVFERAVDLRAALGITEHSHGDTQPAESTGQPTIADDARPAVDAGGSPAVGDGAGSSDGAAASAPTAALTPASDDEINSWDASDPALQWSEQHAYHAGFAAGWYQAERRLGVRELGTATCRMPWETEDAQPAEGEGK